MHAGAPRLLRLLQAVGTGHRQRLDAGLLPQALCLGDHRWADLLGSGLWRQTAGAVELLQALLDLVLLDLSRGGRVLGRFARELRLLGLLLRGELLCRSVLLLVAPAFQRRLQQVGQSIVLGVRNRKR